MTLISINKRVLPFLLTFCLSFSLWAAKSLLWGECGAHSSHIHYAMNVLELDSCYDMTPTSSCPGRKDWDLPLSSCRDLIGVVDSIIIVERDKKDLIMIEPKDENLPKKRKRR